MSLLDKLQKNTTIRDTDILSDSKFFNAKDLIPSPIPMVNVALSGKLDGGLAPGLTVFAGPSKHFKTAFALMLAKSYLDKYADGVVLFYDSEFGSPQSYFDSFGIDTKRVLHTPITDIEQLKHDSMAQMVNIERGDHVMIIVDSVGNLASKKEVEDALEGKSVADMTRAKQLKSLFRMVTPHLTIKDIPMIVVNHTYKEQGMFPKDVVSGGTGIYYSADAIFIIGRQQEKDGTELKGYKFIINVEKSRYVREKSKIPVEVGFESGISKWGGLLDVALEGGFVVKPSNGWYSHRGEEKKYRLDDTYNKDFWTPVLTDQEFKDYVEKNYRISNSSLNQDLGADDIDAAYEEAAGITKV
jgi:RecA/RadA recombinase